MTVCTANLLPSSQTNSKSFLGHQAGSVCGAGLSGKPSLMLGFEIRIQSFRFFSSPVSFVECVPAMAYSAAARGHGRHGPREPGRCRL